MVRDFVVRTLVCPETRELAMLFLAAYVFLLRVPSEALPMATQASNSTGAAVPVFTLRGNMVELWLPKRKNRRSPSTQFRPCWCKKCPLTCPVHVLGAYMTQFPSGTQPFLGITPAKAGIGLRKLLRDTGVPNASSYVPHDARRGHAEDLRRGGATLGEILRAGDWRSPAFLQYLNAEQLDLDRIAEAHDLVSSDDEDVCAQR